ncbi:MAG: YbhB/YbcL family Raf kinase inhibitor-like protein [Syntrophaceae bacterium]|nr:YbhB/YbcL family Raf kinase inhibitor-like protein [Deltaproteobacteria bacterium]
MRINRTLSVFTLSLSLALMPAVSSAGAFELSSTAFKAGEPIPTRHTCRGEDVSPPLAWSGAPKATRSFALICDDPDAPLATWVHWVYYDIPASVYALPEAIGSAEKPSPGGTSGKNSFRKAGYGGPCPPFGTHRYFFRLYALDTFLGLKAGATKKELVKAMNGHILDQAELMGTYRKP